MQVSKYCTENNIGNVCVIGQKEKTTIHSKSSQEFMREVVKAGSWQLNIMENGFMPDFISLPPKYDEKNNKSAVKNMEVVKKKVAVWLKEGHVEKLPAKATCNSPLTVSDKLDVDTGKVKKRVCLDLSRHVNKFLKKHSTNFEDLAATASLYKQGDFMCVFDLENQYFHVQLAETAKQFFGFSLPEEDGTETAYQFKVMVYGFAAAGSVVTRLIKPLQSHLHNKGIRTAIYMDDGQVVAGSAAATEAAMKEATNTFQKAGWNIQWEKTSMQARQDCKYLGFNIMLETLEYKAAPAKEKKVIRLVEQLCGSVTSPRSF